MRILIVGSDTSLGEAMLDFFLIQGRHAVDALPRGECRWKSERQAKKALRGANCDLVVDARIAAATDAGDTIFDLDISRTFWLAKASHRSGVGYLYISSSRVFSGTVERLYSEDDYPDSEDTLGELLLRSETAVRDSCEKYLILRMGPVFSPNNSNGMAHVLDRLVGGDTLVLNSSVRDSPVLANDAGRVVAALVDQLSTHADVWGIYHYCSSEATNSYEFAESLMASATQFSEFAPTVVLEKQKMSSVPLNRALDCTKIRNTFAIKQESWHGAIADAVKHYFHTQP